MTPRTLQQRILVFILVPVFVILAAMGWLSFIYARSIILAQWGETAVSELQKAAHMIDMRLSQPKNLLLMLKQNSTTVRDATVHQFILDRIQNLDGVVAVNYNGAAIFENAARFSMPYRHATRTMEPGHQAGSVRFSLPRYNVEVDRETISLFMDFTDETTRKTGQIEVVISFQDLIDKIREQTWWQSDIAYLIDNDGNILSAAQPLEKSSAAPQKFGTTDPLEIKTLEALKQNASGTVFDKGLPPKEISGYYHLQEAPWSLIIISPGEKVLTTVLNFRLYYLGFGLLVIVGVTLFIRLAISGTVKAIKQVSDAAQSLASGKSIKDLRVTSRDEVGELTHNFNRMTRQLEERIQMKKAMSIAMEVQQSLLPPTSLSFKNLDISGRTVYCDQTGGDFFDIIELPDHPDRICVAVGDVVGHGIGAALLMTTTRALVRSRVRQGGSLARAMDDVNQLLCMDTRDSGRFVTLFLLMIDLKHNILTWVRAGHEPAMVYHPHSSEISTLKGDGLVLGLDRDWVYAEQTSRELSAGTTILIGTDGIWDVKNHADQRFGKQRVETLLKESTLLSAQDVITAILDQTAAFRGKVEQNDDITLLVLKMR